QLPLIRGNVLSVWRALSCFLVHSFQQPNFHDKHSTPILLNGATFCLVTWAYATTQIGIGWNLSPFGRVIKSWRDLYQLMLSEMSRARRSLYTSTTILYDDQF
uniref:Cytochrome c oxidase subunit 7B, mitochondrial n=1 Tax=Sarcophilus harrisii TaxID=9305 RepID=A0A7N4NUU7_SARHA